MGKTKRQHENVYVDHDQYAALVQLAKRTRIPAKPSVVGPDAARLYPQCEAGKSAVVDLQGLFRGLGHFAREQVRSNDGVRWARGTCPHLLKVSDSVERERGDGPFVFKGADANAASVLRARRPLETETGRT